MKAQDLKNSILQLAIQGKLVAQDANDEPAEVLYAKIQAEKQKLIKEGKIKKDKPLTPITDDEIPYEIPSTWKWVRLGDIVNNLTAGGDKPKVFSENRTEHNIYPVIANGKINDGILGYTDKPVVTSKSITVSGRGTMGFVCIREANFVPIVRLLVLQINTSMDITFLKYTIEALVGEGTGSAVQQLTVPMLKPLLIPLPPLAEQKRIVAKIEELEPFVKQYDKAETELSVLNDSFPEQLKKSILQYAIQGKLVAQDANDEPAEVLYAQIQAEKQRLIKEGKIKKDKPLPPIADDEIPFTIPSTWKWVRLGDCYDVRDGTHDTPKYVSTGVPLVTSKNLSNGMLDLSNVKFISLEDAKKIDERSKVDRNDVLFAMIGTIGNPVIVDVESNFCIKNMALIKYNKFMDTNYILYLLIKAQDDMKKEAQGAVQSFVSLSFIRNFPIPLPPLAEQKRIVAKVNDLMQYCEKLKS